MSSSAVHTVQPDTQHSKKLQRARVAGIVLQDLPIERFRLRQLPSSVVGHGLRKQFVRR